MCSGTVIIIIILYTCTLSYSISSAYIHAHTCLTHQHIYIIIYIRIVYICTCINYMQCCIYRVYNLSRCAALWRVVLLAVSLGSCAVPVAGVGWVLLSLWTLMCSPLAWLIVYITPARLIAKRHLCCIITSPQDARQWAVN